MPIVTFPALSSLNVSRFRIDIQGCLAWGRVSFKRSITQGLQGIIVCMSFLLLILTFPYETLPNATVGRVVAVTDGDTLTLLVGQEQLKIRLEGIDAPEKGQPYGQDAKAALSDRAFGRWAVVLWRDTDRNGRTLGHVLTPTWTNYQLVADGHAWHFKRYSKSGASAAAEIEARAANRGLWAGVPVAPWEWRKS